MAAHLGSSPYDCLPTGLEVLEVLPRKPNAMNVARGGIPFARVRRTTVIDAVDCCAISPCAYSYMTTWPACRFECSIGKLCVSGRLQVS
jgi:hypothetical protein